MSRYLLDTNIVSSLIRLRGASPAFRLASHHRTQVCTSVIVASEIRFGITKKGSLRLETEAERVLNGLVVLPFEAPADTFYGTVRVDLERRRLTISANDLLIAAHCLAVDATLVTNNTREFERVKNLRIEDRLAA